MGKPEIRTLQTIDRALAVIELLSHQTDGMKLSAMARELELKPQTLLGIVRSLQASAVVFQEEAGGLYHLGPRISAWQQRWLDHNGLAVSARPAVQALARDIQEQVILAELRGHHLRALVRVDVQNEVMLAMPMDSEQSLHAMSTSKLLMAFLPKEEQEEIISTLQFTRFAVNTITDAARFREVLAEIRADGYAVSREERAPGVISLAVPVFEPCGRIRAALGLYAPTLRVDDQRLEELLTSTRRVAGELEKIFYSQP